MFEKTQYVIEPFRERKGFFKRPSFVGYSVKDVNGTILGYFKEQSLKLRPKLTRIFLVESPDGSILGEIQEVEGDQKMLGFMGLVDRYEVYDTLNQFKGCIRLEKRPDKTRRANLALIFTISSFLLCFPGSLFLDALFGVPLMTSIIIGFVLTICGLIYAGYLGAREMKSRYQMEDSEGRLLAMADSTFHRWLAQVLTPYGGVIAQITPKNGRPRLIYGGSSYRVNISGNIDPFLTLSYAILMADKVKQQRESRVDID